MSCHHPPTPFYDNAENRFLWLQAVELYEDFLGPDSEVWSQREERFLVVLNDLRVALREMPRRAQVIGSERDGSGW